MNLFEIPCNADGRKVRILDSNVTGVRVYVVDTPCQCPLCLDDTNDVQFIEENTAGGDKEDKYFEERLSDCFE